MRKVKMVIAMISICLSGSVVGQEDSVKTIMTNPKWMSNSPGAELKIASREYYSGFGLILFGGFTICIGSIGDSPDVDKPMLFVGSGFALLGSILMLDSHKHIYRAGILMDERGVGVKIKL